MSWSKEEEKLYYVTDTYTSLETDTLFFLDDVDWETHGKFIRGFHYLLNKETCKEIKIILSTVGGDISCMFSIYDIIRNSNKPVVVIGTGEICSAGVLILVAGHKRFVTENCVVMTHAGKGGAEGTADEVRARGTYFSWAEKQWAVLMAKHTPKTFVWWKKKSKSESWYLGGQQIVDVGIADAVLTKTDPNDVPF